MSRGRELAAVATLTIALTMAARPLAAQGMTGPIDLGGVRTGTVQLDPAQATPPQDRLVRPSPAANAAAPKLDIKAFYGKFGGTGFADGDDAAYFGMSQRDLDVQIEGAANGGFRVTWTTVLRDSSDPKVPHFRRRQATLTFVPGTKPDVYQASESGDPLSGGTVSWANITRNTLTVHQFTVLPDGRHDVQTYARTLSGTGMDLVYTRVVEGERQRRVKGKLVKNEK
jgi:hypothetical protein